MATALCKSVEILIRKRRTSSTRSCLYSSLVRVMAIRGVSQYRIHALKTLCASPSTTRWLFLIAASSKNTSMLSHLKERAAVRRVTWTSLCQIPPLATKLLSLTRLRSPTRLSTLQMLLSKSSISGKVAIQSRMKKQCSSSGSCSRTLFPTL